MQVTGVLLALLDMPADQAAAYNRWYDLDHMPEHVAKDDILYGRRYVATREIRRSPAIESGPMTNGHPPYATIYTFGGPLDFASEAATKGWTDLDREITKAGRYWRQGSVALAGRFRLDAARARPSVLVQERAVPHLAHRGIIVAIGRVGSAEDRSKAAEWWDRTRLVDLFAVPGLLAALRFSPVDGDRFSSFDGDQASLMIHVLLCDAPPQQVMTGVAAAEPGWRALGRWPAHNGSYEQLAFLPYEVIAPFEYGFDTSDDPR
jgi:hypothetical protein